MSSPQILPSDDTGGAGTADASAAGGATVGNLCQWLLTLLDEDGGGGADGGHGRRRREELQAAASAAAAAGGGGSSSGSNAALLRQLDEHFSLNVVPREPAAAAAPAAAEAVGVPGIRKTSF